MTGSVDDTFAGAVEDEFTLVSKFQSLKRTLLQKLKTILLNNNKK